RRAIDALAVDVDIQRDVVPAGALRDRGDLRVHAVAVDVDRNVDVRGFLRNVGDATNVPCESVGVDDGRDLDAGAALDPLQVLFRRPAERGRVRENAHRYAPDLTSSRPRHDSPLAVEFGHGHHATCRL